MVLFDQCLLTFQRSSINNHLSLKSFFWLPGVSNRMHMDSHMSFRMVVLQIIRTCGTWDKLLKGLDSTFAGIPSSTDDTVLMLCGWKKYNITRGRSCELRLWYVNGNDRLKLLDGLLRPRESMLGVKKVSEVTEKKWTLKCWAQSLWFNLILLPMILLTLNFGIETKYIDLFYLAYK